MSRFAISTIPTPIYNTLHIPFFERVLTKDEQGLIRSIEMIAFPGTKWTVIEKINEFVLQVSTQEYLSDQSLYIDSRFVRLYEEEPDERKKGVLPSSQQILDGINSKIGCRYFWGGNWSKGIIQMTQFYTRLTSANDHDDLLCKGVDCSGLLFEATNGVTPRNTSELINYGKEVCSPYDDLNQVQSAVKALDLIVWKGHVVIVKDANTLIESRIGYGVVESNFKQRYEEILKFASKQNKKIYIRRWHPDFLS